MVNLQLQIHIEQHVVHCLDSFAREDSTPNMADFGPREKGQWTFPLITKILI
jgi:hypothetical protein